MKTKSKLALLFTIDAMKGKTRSLWTFTTWTAQSVDFAAAQWSVLQARLVYNGFKFVRVFEMHETHGLHVHVVTDEYFDIRLAYKLQRGTIWGHIDLQSQTDAEGAARYVAKYVAKAKDEGNLKGRRLWAACGLRGSPQYTRAADVVLSCPRNRVVSDTYLGRHWEYVKAWTGIDCTTGIDSTVPF